MQFVSVELVAAVDSNNGTIVNRRRHVINLLRIANN